VTNTIFHDKSMLFLVLIVAFFVGASTTDALMDDAFAGNHGNNGNNGCENANPNAKACENNPNTEPPNTEPFIDPTEGARGTFFTITDPQGRIQAGDVAIFASTVHTHIEYVADITTINDTTLTGTFTGIIGGEFLVRVESSDGSVERFSGISFTSTDCIPPNC